MTEILVNKKELDKKEGRGCGCSGSSPCCGSSSDAADSSKNSGGKLTIDGEDVLIHPEDKNIVDTAKRAGISIPAPCYRSERKTGCCHGCVVEIDGNQSFACSSMPEDGMNIVVNREDLKAIRKENILKYKKGIKDGNFTRCSS